MKELLQLLMYYFIFKKKSLDSYEVVKIMRRWERHPVIHVPKELRTSYRLSVLKQM